MRSFNDIKNLQKSQGNAAKAKDYGWWSSFSIYLEISIISCTESATPKISVEMTETCFTFIRMLPKNIWLDDDDDDHDDVDD